MSQDNDLPGLLKPRRLLHGEITYHEAKEQESNILHQLGYTDERDRFFNHLHQNRKSIAILTAHHLGLSSTASCRVVDVKDWIHGSFNVCIRVDINTGRGQDPERQVMIRFPLPYRVRESSPPDNADEKVRCEVGTYAWLQENSPTVPIPHLYGFGLAAGQTFTHLDNLPFLTRIFHRARRRVLSWFGYPLPSQYVQHQSKDQVALGMPYLLIEYIKPSRGKMLAESWEDGRSNLQLRKNLFHGISRIMLAMAHTPLLRIGSFVLDEAGYLTSSRPLTCNIQQLENEDIPVHMRQDATHTTVDSYINDILAIHESRLRHQPNAVNSVEDGLYQTSALMVMRSVWSCFFRQDLLRGPFFMSLTDLNQTNIFVDDNWNIACLIDLEWACSQPVEMIHPPYWLTNEAIDSISADYEKLHRKFMEAFAEEETRAELPFSLHAILQQGWERGTFWYSLALSSPPAALFKIFYDYIQPKFSTVHDDPAFWRITMPYWTFDAYEFIKQKVKDREQYDVLLREAFGRESSQAQSL
ncbi:uncharacterized protein ACLA_006910 [Aspergillus clavatus NRRL 1]|uniref:Aminoglycoside phosphotransferase domain-containing protein n=1 Tax=Aspergillus clavatus (strain ATCC 1007 / CBS 513.65 / DSM 816 / NCTC 3887 / NRRL 1 / QM 1276 / 107) TaxID=344612 RepID=A1CDK5_ASPCL|nr:uncharacterized protein ACLA_006910 [Aspergillus clavatus NRRL 1]EAW11932.1 conserved hypothetical protein [Aspergillus clavatus NRRL 1]